ncbi:hypothetical protein BBF96_03755 [Anoxybacter fermentans]|uniref:Regulatory protein RecX n=1 Tax=Anoxybacter fermentans TaxID=1323375 RepID=A0A3Q9HQW4_9FIRM|nr:RecX family transcriptional regulator [Anoxybacter fermentans]AZR72577.1 hypothetical protein BBF96_03755 [Anoxybacter fermentans]
MRENNPEFQKAKKQVFRYLRYRERSEKEVRDYLRRKGYRSEVIKAVIERLKELDYLNDRRFAELWVKNRTNSGRRGPILVKKELQEKGIDHNLIEDIISVEYTPGREFDIACELLKKKIKLYQGENFETVKARLWKLLERKGFRYQVIENVVEQVLKEEIKN